MSDLVDFLTARLAEDEQMARDGAFCRGPEWAVSEEPPFVWGVDPPDPQIIASGKPIVRCDDEYGGGLAAPHIARHDPARVLAEVAAKRRIVELHSGAHECSRFDRDGEIDNCTWCLDSDECSTVALLASVYVDHSQYRPEWHPDTVAKHH